MGTARTKGAVWAWLVVIGCIGFYSIPTGIIGNTSGIFVAPVMDQFGWTQTDTTMYRTIQPLVAAVCAPIAGKLMEKYNPRWILAAVSAAFGPVSYTHLDVYKRQPLPCSLADLRFQQHRAGGEAAAECDEHYLVAAPDAAGVVRVA